MTASALLAVLLLAAGGAQRTGQVLQSTPKRAYLSAGASDGLQPGMKLTSGERSCAVERTSEHGATCTGDLRPGDRFALPEAPDGPVASARPKPPRLSASEVERRRGALAEVQVPLVEFAPSSVSAEPAYARRVLRIAVGHATWAQSGVGPYQQERADVWLRAPIAGPLRLDADFSAQRWSSRPASTRFRPDDPWQLYVREAALSAASSAGARASLGRQRPFAPGATALDGLSAAFRFAGGAELGVYGGALPDPSTSAPSTDRLTLGAAWRVQHAGESGELVRQARHQGRAAVIALPGGDKRYEVEADGLVQLGRAVDLSGDVRLAAGAYAPDAAIDALRLDLVARVGSRVRVYSGFRHQALPFPVDALTSKVATPDSASAFSGGASRHGDLGATWDVLDGLSLSAAGGIAAEAGSGLSRSFVGPELALPGLWSGALTLSGGYLEERGWLAGRSAWAQASLAPRSWLNALLRASWSLDRRGDVAGSTQEVGVFAAASARPTGWLELRGSLLGRLSRGTDAAGVAAAITAAGEF